MQSETRKQIANVTSNVLNPFLLSLLLILLLSFVSVPGIVDALRWALIATALSVLPVFVVVAYLVKSGSLDAFFIVIREQRTKVYLLSSACAIIGYIILALLKAPPMLVAGFTAGLLMAVVFMCINLWWKISLHTAFVAASATVLLLLYGWIAALTLPLVPLTAWSRVELKYHSPAQATAGAFLAALIVAVVFSVTI